MQCTLALASICLLGCSFAGEGIEPWATSEFRWARPRRAESFAVRARAVPSTPETTENAECLALKPEFDAVCLALSQRGMEDERKAFCDAYKSSCAAFIKNAISSAQSTSFSSTAEDLSSKSSARPMPIVGETGGAIISETAQASAHAENATAEAADKQKASFQSLAAARDDESCIPLKPEFDKICSVPPKGKAAAEITLFCDEFRSRCTNLLQEGVGGSTLSAGLQAPAEENEEEECLSLKSEYVNMCVTPAANAKSLSDMKVFCEAYESQCGSAVKSLRGEAGTDHAAYCKKHVQRFEYVCPNPLRFGKYTSDAVDFCSRYRDRCPEQPLPSEPVSFRKKETHIYIREVEFICARYKRFAETYCANPVVLKLTKYAIPCLLYKMRCIDALTSVIYA